MVDVSTGTAGEVSYKDLTELWQSYPNLLLELAKDLLCTDRERIAGDASHQSGVEEIDYVEERGDGVDVDAQHNGGFSGVGSGKDDIGNFLFTGKDGNGEHTGNRADATVEAQLTYEKKAINVVDAESPICTKNADGDGKIETGTFFLEVGGCQIDGGNRGRDEIARVLNRGAHAIPAFTNGRIRQAHGVKDIFVDDYAAVINLYVDQVSVDSIYGCTESFEEHRRFVFRSETPEVSCSYRTKRLAAHAMLAGAVSRSRRSIRNFAGSVADALQRKMGCSSQVFRGRPAHPKPEERRFRVSTQLI